MFSLKQVIHAMRPWPNFNFDVHAAILSIQFAPLQDQLLHPLINFVSPLNFTNLDHSLMTIDYNYCFGPSTNMACNSMITW